MPDIVSFLSKQNWLGKQFQYERVALSPLRSRLRTSRVALASSSPYGSALRYAPLLSLSVSHINPLELAQNLAIVAYWTRSFPTLVKSS